ncbi:MAG TPA: hypothetical protein VHL78_03615 [Actinomycetota bacterium]|nr:hypothetical protein [Actinomycetota bacterium]
MRKRLPLVLIAVLTGVVMLGPGAPVSSEESQETTLRLFEGMPTFIRDIDEKPKGESPGDWSVVIAPLFDPQTCQRVGRNVGRFVLVRPLRGGDAWAIIDSTLNLRQGRITIYGSFRFSEFFGGGVDHAVTGGTEAFKFARGDVVVGPADLCGQEGSIYEFDLRLD